MHVRPVFVQNPCETCMTNLRMTVPGFEDLPRQSSMPKTRNQQVLDVFVVLQVNQCMMLP